MAKRVAKAKKPIQESRQDDRETTPVSPPALSVSEPRFEHPHAPPRVRLGEQTDRVAAIARFDDRKRLGLGGVEQRDQLLHGHARKKHDVAPTDSV